MRILKLWLPVLVWAGLILCAASDSFSAESSDSLLRTIFGVSVPVWLHVALRKLAHLVGYGILAALTWRADRRWEVIMLVVVVVAACDEMLQGRTMSRTGSLIDVVIDIVGALIALIALQSKFKKET